MTRIADVPKNGHTVTARRGCPETYCYGRRNTIDFIGEYLDMRAYA
jgi:hypothetical protein